MKYSRRGRAGRRPSFSRRNRGRGRRRSSSRGYFVSRGGIRL